MNQKEQKIESRIERIKMLNNDYEIMNLVKDSIENDKNTVDSIRQLLKTRIHNNMLDRMLILKEIEIISQQP